MGLVLKYHEMICKDHGMKCIVPNVTWITKYSAVRKPDRQKRQKTVLLDAHNEGSSLIQTDLCAANSVTSLSSQMN